jgi:predicted Zn finger-like uncharacterized protein
MFTVCPKCALTLVVTAADLGVAQGYVRCGRCSSVFNALARLSEDRGAGTPAEPAVQSSATAQDTALPAAVAAAAPPPRAAAPAPAAEETIGEESLEFNPDTTDVNSVFVQAPLDPQWAAATGSFRTLVAANQERAAAEPPDPQGEVEIDGDFLAAMLRTEAGTAPAAPLLPAPAARRGAAVAASAVRFDMEAPAEAAAAPQEDEPQPALTIATPVEHEREPLSARAWMLAAALGALLLGAQMVNHDRDELAANARFNRPLTSLYRAFGVTLYPHWDLHAYDVRQLGAEADPAGAGLITVRASIKNAAAQPQPLPLLRVTLQDRFGNRIAARDVGPRSYLPASIPAASFLSAGQRIDAEMGFADPGTDAVGFEIDACLPARGGVACANDAALR